MRLPLKKQTSFDNLLRRKGTIFLLFIVLALSLFLLTQTFEVEVSTLVGIPVRSDDFLFQQLKPDVDYEEVPVRYFIFKKARSGSSWLATLLSPEIYSLKEGQWKYVFFVPEAGCGEVFSASHFRDWAHLNSHKVREDDSDYLSLMGRYLRLLFSPKKMKIPFESECPHFGKCCTIHTPQHYSAIGASSKLPTNYNTSDIHKLFLSPSLKNQDVSPVRMAVLIRTNLVKWGLSHILVDEQLEKCGSHKRLCSSLDSQTKVQADDLLEAIHSARRRVDDLLYYSQYAANLTAPEVKNFLHLQKHPNEVFKFYYEELQMNKTKVLEEFAQFLGVQRHPREAYYTSIHKRASEDLSEMLLNYDKIEKFLQPHTCLLKQLQAKESQLFPLCSPDSSGLWRIEEDFATYVPQQVASSPE